MYISYPPSQEWSLFFTFYPTMLRFERNRFPEKKMIFSSSKKKLWDILKKMFWEISNIFFFKWMKSSENVKNHEKISCWNYRLLKFIIFGTIFFPKWTSSENFCNPEKKNCEIFLWIRFKKMFVNNSDIGHDSETNTSNIRFSGIQI